MMPSRITPESMNQCWMRWWMSKRMTRLAPRRARVPCAVLRREPLAQLVDEVDEDVEREEEQRERGEPRERDVDDVRDGVPARLLRRLVRDERREVRRSSPRGSARRSATRFAPTTGRRRVGLRDDRVRAALPWQPRGSSCTRARAAADARRAGRGSSRGTSSGLGVQARGLGERRVPVARLAAAARISRRSAGDAAGAGSPSASNARAASTACGEPWHEAQVGPATFVSSREPLAVDRRLRARRVCSVWQLAQAR